MKLIVLGSSSKGNGYVLMNKDEAIVIEAGVRLREVKKAVDYRVSMIKACLVSHSHNDHGGYAHEYAAAGINVMGPGDVFVIPHNRNRPVQPGVRFQAGKFRVLPFALHHDVTCYGYVIDHPDSGVVAFLTDTYLCEYQIANVSHWIIECNYADDILEENIIQGREHPAMRKRLLETHMELESTKATISASGMDSLRTVTLAHLSDRNSDQRRFVSEVEALTGKRVFAAEKGLEVNLEKIPI